jgi:hypothetical protein
MGLSAASYRFPFLGAKESVGLHRLSVPHFGELLRSARDAQIELRSPSATGDRGRERRCAQKGPGAQIVLKIFAISQQSTDERLRSVSVVYNVNLVDG